MRLRQGVIAVGRVRLGRVRSALHRWRNLVAQPQRVLSSGMSPREADPPWPPESLATLARERRLMASPAAGQAS